MYMTSENQLGKLHHKTAHRIYDKQQHPMVSHITVMKKIKKQKQQQQEKKEIHTEHIQNSDASLLT